MRRNSEKYESNSSQVFILFAILFSIFQITRLKYHKKELEMRKSLLDHIVFVLGNIKLLSTAGISVLSSEWPRRKMLLIYCERKILLLKRVVIHTSSNISFARFNPIFHIFSKHPKYLCLAFDWYLSEVNSFHLTLLSDERIE